MMLEELQLRNYAQNTTRLSIPKMPSGESAFEISDIQEERNREPGPNKAQNIPM